MPARKRVEFKTYILQILLADEFDDDFTSV